MYCTIPRRRSKSLVTTHSAVSWVSTTTILCDDKCAEGIVLDTMKPKRTESISMRFHWIRDRIQQKQFIVIWRKGADSLADFFTKPLRVHVHQSLIPLLVHIPPAPPSALLISSGARAAKWEKNPQQS